MRFRPSSAALSAALVFAASSAAFAGDPPAPPAENAGAAPAWEAEFDAGVARAKSEKKDLLVEFTGSDWCPPCKRLHEKVFSQDDFAAAASKDYVLVALDFPRGEAAKAKVPNAARNQELTEKYGIDGFPTVLLLTADGDVFGRTGFLDGGPTEYVEHLAKLRADGRPALVEAIEMEKAFAAAKDDEKPAFVEKALARLAALEPGAAPGGRLAKVAQAGLALDPKGEKGLRTRVIGELLRSGHADAGLATEARALDPKNEKGLLEKAVAFELTKVDSIEGVKDAVASIEAVEATGKWVDEATHRHLLATAAFFCKQHLQEEDAAKAWARKLKAITPANDENLQGLIKYILGDEAAGEPAKDPAKGPEKAPEEKAPAKE